jgi:hypothetical protein
LADYRTCASRAHEREAEELLRFEEPRAAALLPKVGRTVKSAFSP